MSESKQSFKDLLSGVITKENISYILGTKKNGSQRAPYDVFKELHVDKGKSKKKSKKHRKGNSYSIFLDTRKKRKKKKSKHFSF